MKAAALFAFEAALAASLAGSPAVQAGVKTALAHVDWRRLARWLPTRLQRTDVRKTGHFGELAQRCERPA